MTKSFRCRWCAIVLSALAGVLALPGDHAARSQTATIKIVVPYPPGGGIDATARLFAEHIGKGQGPKMIIENRPGAASIIGTESVDHAPADGSTVLFATNTLVVLPQLRTLSYDPRTAFDAICSVASTPIVVVVNSASPYRTLDGLIGAARKNPGALTLAIVPAGVLHVAYEMLAAAANINMTLVPFTGTVAEITSVLGGHVTATLADYPSAAPQIQAGKLRALAIGSKSRIDGLPGVPTIAESGYPSYAADLWYGVFAPSKTPKEKLAQLADWFAAASRDPEIKEKLSLLGLYPTTLCNAQFADFIRTQYAEYGRVIRAANMKVE